MFVSNRRRFYVLNASSFLFCLKHTSILYDSRSMGKTRRRAGGILEGTPHWFSPASDAIHGIMPLPYKFCVMNLGPDQ